MNDARATEWHGARMMADWLMAVAEVRPDIVAPEALARLLCEADIMASQWHARYASEGLAYGKLARPGETGGNWQVTDTPASIVSAPIYELLDAGGVTDASARRVLQAHLDARGQCY